MAWNIVNPVSNSNDLAEMSLLLGQLLRGAAGQTPNASGQTRVSIDAGTLPVVQTVQAVTAITNPVTMAGGISNLLALALRNGIVVS